MRPLIVGVDIGFAHLGIVKAELMPQGFTVISTDVICTEKSDKKRGVKAADDNIRRVTEIAEHLGRWIDDQIIVVCAEALSLPRNASAASKISLAFGALATVSALSNVPIIQASPQEVKIAVTGKKTASKAEMIAEIKKRHTKIKWPTPKSLEEHVADATSVIIACLNHPVIVSAKKMMDRNVCTGEEMSNVLVLPARS